MNTELAIIALCVLMLVLGFLLGWLWKWIESEPGLTDDESIGMEAQAGYVEKLRDEMCGVATK